jgi:hypothetical protein
MRITHIKEHLTFHFQSEETVSRLFNMEISLNLESITNHLRICIIKDKPSLTSKQILHRITKNQRAININEVKDQI